MKKFISILLVCLMVIGMAGCGNSGSQASGKPEDRVLKLRSNNVLTSADWQTTTLTTDMEILWVQVFEGLKGIDESKGGYINLLAKDIQASEDGLTYTVTLQDAKFHNGDTLKASDVVFSYDLAMQNSRFNYVTSFINNIEAKDDKTVVFTLDYPYSAIDHTFWTVKIYSQREYEEVVSSGKEFGTEPHTAGTGPYVLTAFDANSITLKAFEDYWNGAPEIKNVRYQVISEDAAAVIAFENGELDYFNGVPASDWENIVKKAGEENSEMITANDVQVMFINYLSPTNNNVLGNQKVREAIMYAINKDDCLNAAYSGYGKVAYEYMFHEYVATSPNYEKGEFTTYDFNLEKAHQCLLDAGFSEDEIAAGIDVGTVMTYGDPTAPKGKMAVVLQANLAAAGMKAEVDIADYSVNGDKMYAQDYDIAIFGDSGNFDFNNIRQQVHSESVGMYLVRYRDPESPFDADYIEGLVDQGVAVTSVEDRYATYTELWKYISDTATIMPLTHSGKGIAWSKNIKMDGLCPSYYHIDGFHWAN